MTSQVNISHNRINWDGAILIAKGIKENDTLETLDIGYNELTMTGCMDILDAVDSKNSMVIHYQRGNTTAMTIHCRSRISAWLV